uniref:Uncharacterized protein n=1 Tax=Hucho hucho TaxID=62062 RepID=A0A4W5PY55_9TELE
MCVCNPVTCCIYVSQCELGTLWCELQRDRPEMLSILEDVLVHSVSHLQDSLRERDSLEQALRRRESDHDRVVRSIYEEMESQNREEREKRLAQVRGEKEGGEGERREGRGREERGGSNCHWTPLSLSRTVLKVSKNMQKEKDSLQRQLELLRDMNKRLRDEKDTHQSQKRVSQSVTPSPLPHSHCHCTCSPWTHPLLPILNHASSPWTHPHYPY